MADQAEHAFAATFLNTISTQPVIFDDTYQQSPVYCLRRVPVLHTSVPPVPATKKSQAETSGAAIQITFKSIKPSASYSLSVNPTDTVSSIKSLLTHTHASAPPPDAQRLLLKGKALADNKLLKEYPVKAGDVLTLVIKPGVEWDPNRPKVAPNKSTPSTITSPSPTSMLSVDNMKPPPGPDGARKKHKHQRIPSVVLSPSPSTSTTDLLAGVDAPPGGAGTQEKDILLTLDATDVPQPLYPETLSTYHDTVANPEYWARLMDFLASEFTSDADAIHAFEDYLRATKASLTANEIAKIRDHTGIVGMAGT
jgi:UV excision repair protein RAD23